jgi:hypothetical protein
LIGASMLVVFDLGKLLRVALPQVEISEKKNPNQLYRESEAWKCHLPSLLNHSVGLFKGLWW